jgi:hypothetical protein
VLGKGCVRIGTLLGIVNDSTDGRQHCPLRDRQAHDTYSHENKSVQVANKHFFLRALCGRDNDPSRQRNPGILPDN